MKRILAGLILVVMFSVQAQSTWPRQVLFQSAAAIVEARTPTNSILFTFESNYPPSNHTNGRHSAISDALYSPWHLEFTD